MAEGNDNKQSAPESGEILRLYDNQPSLWVQTPCSLSIGEAEVDHFSDIDHLLSNVELCFPPPPPVSEEEILVGFHKGESSGTKRKSYDQISHETSRRMRSAERRRCRIKEKLRALQELIPSCNKSDKATMLDDAIEYIKYLQWQVKLNQGVGAMSQALYMSPAWHQNLQAPYFSPYDMMGMGYGMGIYNSGYSTGFPIFPAFVSNFSSVQSSGASGLPLMGESGLLPVSQLSLPFHSSQPYPSTLSSNTIIPTTNSEIVPRIDEDFYPIPETSQGSLRGSNAMVQPSHIVRPSFFSSNVVDDDDVPQRGQGSSKD